ncbi:unnamed protein product [Malus baccata var. baccata]
MLRRWRTNLRRASIRFGIWVGVCGTGEGGSAAMWADVGFAHKAGGEAEGGVSTQDCPDERW